jgi:hypothetical protein
MLIEINVLSVELIFPFKIPAILPAVTLFHKTITIGLSNSNALP